jgi:hypothetical protein
VSDERSSANFLRGLTIGALIGAIIAGSRVWSRWRGRLRTRRDDDAPAA